MAASALRVDSTLSPTLEISLYQALMLCKSVSNQGKGRRAIGHSQKNPLHSAQCGRLGFCSKFDCS